MDAEHDLQHENPRFAMDSEIQRSIRMEVQNAVTASQSNMMSEIKDIIVSEVGRLHTLNEKLAENQINKIEDTIGDAHKFRKRGNEEQFKHNNKVIVKLQEAENSLTGTIRSDNIESCRRKISEGIDIIKHRQKLIKLADTSEAGWRVVQEYETNPLAEDSEDEKRIFKAQNRAERKVKADKAKRKEKSSRFHPYASGRKDEDTQTSGFRSGRCFGCGKRGHWKKECPEEKQKMSSFSFTSDSVFHLNKAVLTGAQVDVSSGNHSSEKSHLTFNEVKSPVGRLKGHLTT